MHFKTAEAYIYKLLLKPRSKPPERKSLLQTWASTKKSSKPPVPPTTLRNKNKEVERQGFNTCLVLVTWLLSFLGLLAAIFFHLVPLFLAYLSSLFLIVLNNSVSRWCFDMTFNPCHWKFHFLSAPWTKPNVPSIKTNPKSGCLFRTPHRASATVKNNRQVLHVTQAPIKKALRKEKCSGPQGWVCRFVSGKESRKGAYYYVCLSASVLPSSGWCFLVPIICLQFSWLLQIKLLWKVDTSHITKDKHSKICSPKEAKQGGP